MNLHSNLEKLPYHWLLPLLFFAIGLLYLYASPHFESPDSIYHIGVIKWIAETGALPVQSADHDELYAHEASQPPLYYLLMTPLWQLVDTSDFTDIFHTNPLVIAGHPARLGNRNQVFYRQPHPPDLQGASLAIYLIRLATLGMASVTIYAIYRAALALEPKCVRLAILAAAFAAFNPQFLFISSSVSNDSLAAMLVALASWQMLAMLREGFQTRRSLLLGLLIALASLTKLSGLAMGLVVGICGIYIAIRDRERAGRGLIVLAGSLAAFWLLIAGWWYARNLTLYDELFGTNMLIANFGARSASLSQIIGDEFEGLRISYWGLFGWFSNFTSPLHYLAMDVLSLLAVAGLAVYLFVHRRNHFNSSAVLLLSALVAIAGASLLWYTMRTPSSQGRLLFPVIGAISLLLALGLRTLRLPSWLVVLPLLLFCIVAPFLYIAPHYDHPAAVERLPASASETFAQWNEITLVGYELPAPRRWLPGDEIPLTLFWQPTARSSEPHALFISLIDAAGRALATIDTFPGWGTLPTTDWQPQALYRDEYIVQIPEDASGFTSAQLHIGWYAFPAGSDILPQLGTGEVVAAFTLPVGALVSEDARRALGDDAIAAGAVFGDSLRLNSYQLHDSRLLELEWQLIDEMSGDWRVFAMAFDRAYVPGEPFEILLQQDAVPAVPLAYLRTGETFLTRHEFQLPPGYAGTHGVYVGWYNEDLFARLSLDQPDNMLLLPDLRFDETAS